MEIIFSLDQIDQVAQSILKNLKHKIVLFDAPMGAGKTTMIKALCQELGIQESTSSPTFSIVNQYQSTKQNQTIFHFDLYRLNNEEEAYDMGMEEYLDSGAYCFIEWPEKTPTIIPDNHSIVQISTLSDGSRKLVLQNL